MRERDPKKALEQIIMRDKNSFEMYKDGWQALKGRIDRVLKMGNKIVND